MSKIFDGLKKTEGAIAKLTIDVIGEKGSSHPAPPENGSLTDGKRGEQQSFPGPAIGTERPAGSAFSFEDAAEGIRTLSDRSQREASFPSERPEQSLFGAEAPGAPEFDPAAHAFSDEPAGPDHHPFSEQHSFSEEAAEAFQHAPNPWTEPARHSAGPGAVAIKLRAGSPLLPFDTGEANEAAEEYRRVRTKILQHHLRPRLMLVSSPSAGDGKSITALNICGALALNRDARILLVDMDLRRPKISGLLGIPERVGVAEVLAGACRLEDAIVRLEPFPNLFLLPAGNDRRNPAELLSSPRWKALCEELRSQMTYTVLDGPPVDAVSEYSMLEEFSDGLILVVRTDHTVRPLLNQALESIPKEKLIGSVINGYRESLFWKQRGDYYS